jgi:hypothetical protein
MEVEVINSRKIGLAAWDAKITLSEKFKIGSVNAFSSKGSRNAYIRLLMNGFNTLPEFSNVTFEELFNSDNSYANFQFLLNKVPVPADHDGFYLNDNKKKHLKSASLKSP